MMKKKLLFVCGDTPTQQQHQKKESFVLQAACGLVVFWYGMVQYGGIVPYHT
jgi:hypothetical protein